VRLADPGWSEEDHILAAFDEAELVQALDLLAAQRRLKSEIEVPELLDRGQVSGRAFREFEYPATAAVYRCGSLCSLGGKWHLLRPSG
jgi:hypothetical protein